MADTDLSIPEPGIFSELLSVLFPVRCVHCGKGGNWLCRECACLMRPAGPACCRRCGRPAVRYIAGCPECRGREDLHFHSARAAFTFEGPARSLVHRLKFSGQRRLAGFMAEISLAALRNSLQTSDFINGLTHSGQKVTLTYIPLHHAKLVSRGYNQAGLYAGALAGRLGFPLRDLLSKQHPTTPQNRLNFDQRRKNIINSFSLRKGATAGGRVILVDDVYTTGATTSECSRILTEGLGVKVFTWTFARTVRR